MDDPQVSVIIPCYNCEEHIAAAIDSALVQTYGNKQIIVVNDGSTDGSKDIMEAYDDRIILIGSSNRGAALARNAGIEASSGDLLAFLDADDYWDESFLAKMVDAHVSTGASLVYCGWQNTGLDGDAGGPYVPPDYEAMPDKFTQIIKNTCWPIHGALVKKRVVEAYGGFDSRWPTCEDYALWVRVATDHKIVRVPEVLAFYRHHGESQLTAKRAVIALDHWHRQKEFIKERPELVRQLGREVLRQVMDGELLHRGYVCYWQRDLACARTIFRKVMRDWYGSMKDWKYMLPSILPLPLHRALLKLGEKWT